MLNYSLRAIKRYSKNHEWIDLDGENGLLGISSYLSHHIGDVNYAILNSIQKYKAGEEIGTVEASKNSIPVLAPIDLTVLEGNTLLDNEPSLINKSSERKGWIAKIKIQNENDFNGLMDREAYLKFVESTTQ